MLYLEASEVAQEGKVPWLPSLATCVLFLDLIW